MLSKYSHSLVSVWPEGRYLRLGSCRLVRCIPSRLKEQKYEQWSPRVRPCAGRSHWYLVADPSRPKPSRDHGSRPEARRLIFGRKKCVYLLSRFRVRLKVFFKCPSKMLMTAMQCLRARRLATFGIGKHRAYTFGFSLYTCKMSS